MTPTSKTRLSQQRTLTDGGLDNHVLAHVCVQGKRLARLASLGSLGARVHCGVHGDFLNPFRKSHDVYGV